MLRIATWNINSVRQRLDIAAAWLKERAPDIVALQEIKCQDAQFPREAFEDLGYNVHVHGQKGFNGVALLARMPLEVETGLPGDTQDAQARYIEAVASTAQGAVRVGGLYLPNGNPIGSDRFSYKMAWMDRLIAHAKSRLAFEEPFVLLGDYNVIPSAQDCANAQDWLEDALYQPETKARFRELLALGFTDAVRACEGGQGPYTFWDYQAGSWPRNNGIRIDHALLSPQAADRLKACGIDRALRAQDKPSDHVPVWIDLDL